MKNFSSIACWANIVRAQLQNRFQTESRSTFARFERFISLISHESRSNVDQVTKIFGLSRDFLRLIATPEAVEVTPVAINEHVTYLFWNLIAVYGSVNDINIDI